MEWQGYVSGRDTAREGGSTHAEPPCRAKACAGKQTTKHDFSLELRIILSEVQWKAQSMYFLLGLLEISEIH